LATLELHRTYYLERLQVLLLIASFALVVAWLLGKATELSGLSKRGGIMRYGLNAFMSTTPSFGSSLASLTDSLLS